MIHTRLSVSTKYRDPCAIIVSGIIIKKNKSYIKHSFYFFYNIAYIIVLQYSSLAQLVERVTVNHGVTGPSPVGGATKIKSKDRYILYR